MLLMRKMREVVAASTGTNSQTHGEHQSSWLSFIQASRTLVSQ
jgi:hypothetical protein